eukprot:CAMPEP_0172448222 /NCGR_PEP_ID=MMETSP1065-20121228/7275_1 /TAXON_ID=265537 /ORGANISM="Amphiprora paludosa, Strain CCMP125" /LENGTH=311 /DNA_ID=CAMNT_0013199651 /DNA_START=182 /DNA_END=1117 /DNA_ORIENTATION=-
MISRLNVAAALVLLSATVSTTTAFAPMTTTQQYTAMSTSTTSSSTSLNLYSAAVFPNPFQKLPWNVKKEQERQARRLKVERNQLFRELGIPEDATYEEIVSATDLLIAAAGDDLKQKIKVEVAKDKILQIRLNERLKGLTTLTKEARAQSSFEMAGVEDDDDSASSKKEQGEWNAPLWAKGLIVKPDEAQIKSQVKLWGIITALGLALPPVIDYMGRFTWLICVAQLTFRGMNRDEMDRGGMGLSFGGGSGGGHRKVAFALGFSIWIAGLCAIYGLMPAWAKGQRWTGLLAYTLQNIIFATASCYLQPYKG